MSAKRTERLLNLTICLLSAQRYLSKDQIRQAVPAYAGCPTDEAFERMFERDKDELRELGIPLETGVRDPLFSDEQGYRIDRGAYALPEVAFTPDEMAVLGLAARAWRHASLSHAAGRALLKLRAAGVDPDESAIAGLEPRVGDDEPALLPLWSAAFEGRPVSFSYRTPEDEAARTRRVEPWGVISRNGRWYLVGHDLDRQAPRVFRLSRIDGEVSLTGPAGSVVKPPEADVRDQLRRMLPAEPRQVATVRARPGTAVGLRRRAQREVPAAPPPAPHWDVLELPFWRVDVLADELVSYGPDVIADGPAPLRAAVIERLSVLASAR